MIGAPQGSKLLFRVLLGLHSPERFLRHWQSRFHSFYSTSDLRARHREEYLAVHPTSHPYNDIAGFAEVYWDGGTRILVEYHLRGLKWRRFGSLVVAHWGPNVTSTGLYPIPYIEIAGIPHPRCSRKLKRQAMADALEQVRTMTTDWGCHVDLTYERNVLRAVDVDLLFSE